MKKLLLLTVLFALSVFIGKSYAYTPVFDQGFSSATVKGIACTTGTVIQVDTDRETELTGFRHAGVRIKNHGTEKIWIGYDTVVSTHTGAIGNLGVTLAAEQDGPFAVDEDVSVYCITSDAAGADGTPISIEYFGFN